MHSDLAFDLEAITAALFADANRRRKIMSAYGCDEAISDPAECAAEIVRAMGQDRVVEAATSDEVFRAAVRAIGSNSRQWTDYLRVERELFGDGAALTIAAWKDAVDDPVRSDTAGKLAGGWSPSRSVRWINQWAELLSSERRDYFDDLWKTHAAVSFYSDSSDAPLSGDEVTLVLAARLAHTNSQFPGAAPIGAKAVGKAPGMGLAIAMEFLRNLGFQGFKPDRHIKRLLEGDSRTSAIIAEMDVRAREIGEMAGSCASDLRGALKVALAGLALTPEGTTPTKTDNLVWLYASKFGSSTPGAGGIELVRPRP